MGRRLIRAYLDATPALYRVEERQPWAERIERAIHPAAEITLLTSELTRLECLVLPVRTGNIRLYNKYEAFFSRMRLFPFTRAVFERATALRATHNLKTPDALHLACAIDHGCNEFWTNDARLASGAPPGLVVRVFADAVDASAVPADT